MGMAELYSGLCGDLDSAENVDGSSSPWIVDSLRWHPYRDALTEISQTSLSVKRYTMNRFLVQLYSINLPPQFRSIKYTC